MACLSAAGNPVILVELWGNHGGIMVELWAGLRNTRFRNLTVHLSLKWADLGKMGENGGKCGKIWMLDGKMGNFGG